MLSIQTLIGIDTKYSNTAIQCPSINSFHSQIKYNTHAYVSIHCYSSGTSSRAQTSPRAWRGHASRLQNTPPNSTPLQWRLCLYWLREATMSRSVSRTEPSLWAWRGLIVSWSDNYQCYQYYCAALLQF